MGWADAGDVCDSPPALIGGTFLNVHMWLTVECVVCLAKIIRIYWGVPKFLKINGLRCYRIENTHARADRVLTLKVMLEKKTQHKPISCQQLIGWTRMVIQNIFIRYLPPTANLPCQRGTHLETGTSWRWTASLNKALRPRWKVRCGLQSTWLCGKFGKSETLGSVQDSQPTACTHVGFSRSTVNTAKKPIFRRPTARVVTAATTCRENEQQKEMDKNSRKTAQTREGWDWFSRKNERENWGAGGG